MHGTRTLVAALSLAMAALGGQAAEHAKTCGMMDHSQLLVYRTTDGQQRSVQSAEHWAIRRGQIIKGMAMGELPDRSELPPLDVRVLRRADGEGFVRMSITYLAEQDDRVPAYLLVPEDRPASKRLPAMLALHQTTPLGKKEEGRIPKKAPLLKKSDS